MPKISAADSTTLSVEEIGSGTPVVFMHEVPDAALVVLPRTGHTSEEPAAFNAALADLFCAVEAGRWPVHSAACYGEGHRAEMEPHT
jgi:hypothetical protein